MERPLVVFALLLATIAPQVHGLQADSGAVWISGVVVDPLRRPVEGAEVRIAKTSLATLSLANGSFRLAASIGDSVLVLVRRPGYKAQLLSIRAPWTGTVQLSPGAFELPEVQVTARYAKPAEYAGTTKFDDFFRRRRLGLGQFIDRAEIDRRSPTRVAQILQGRAGIRVDLRPAGASDGRDHPRPHPDRGHRADRDIQGARRASARIQRRQLRGYLGVDPPGEVGRPSASAGS